MEKCLSPETKVLVGKVEDLDEVWDAMTSQSNTVLAQALDPIVKFSKYKVFEHGAVCEFYLLLRSAMMGPEESTCSGS
jgi:hypothetical protein